VKPPEYYRGREQTYLKHFFLERYLERVAYNIGSFADEFVYVDGFSGPWRSTDQEFADTSFVIAINKLREVRQGLAAIHRNPKVRCIFVEKDPAAYQALADATRQFGDIQIKTLNADFESAIQEILRAIGPNAYSFVFIDPTGWTGFGLRQIAPLLRGRGEVLVNFMFDHINRFLETPSPNVSFNELFGGPGWESAIAAGEAREDAIINLYRERMKAIGGFAYVTSTRILKPIAERSYFYLVYGTRHPKGLSEFRAVERQAIEEQERVRLDAGQAHRITKTGQAEMFSAKDLGPGPLTYDQERGRNLLLARQLLDDLLVRKPRLSFVEARAQLMELAMVWETDIKDVVMALKAEGILDIQSLKPRERTPKPGHVLLSCDGLRAP
jgi:three-Cys-motif partner protein